MLQLNATDPSSQCPTGFFLITPSGLMVCIRNDIAAGCTGISTDIIPHSYTQVCGFVRGYGFKSSDGFAVNGIQSPSEPLSGNYVDGVSITYGTPPNHLWTYAAGGLESGGATSSCPCNLNNDTSTIPPSYVGNNYYCEGRIGADTTDPLWDGQQCGGNEGPCCSIPTLPWFSRNMLNSTDDDIMVRVCLDEPRGNENIGLELIKIYIKP